MLHKKETTAIKLNLALLSCNIRTKFEKGILFLKAEVKNKKIANISFFYWSTVLILMGLLKVWVFIHVAGKDNLFIFHQ